MCVFYDRLNFLTLNFIHFNSDFIFLDDRIYLFLLWFDVRHQKAVTDSTKLYTLQDIQICINIERKEKIGKKDLLMGMIGNKKESKIPK